MKNLHIIHFSQPKRWKVMREGGKRSLRNFKNKIDADAWARTWAREHLTKENPTQKIYVHLENGMVDYVITVHTFKEVL